MKRDGEIEDLEEKNKMNRGCDWSISIISSWHSSKPFLNHTLRIFSYVFATSFKFV